MAAGTFLTKVSLEARDTVRRRVVSKDVSHEVTINATSLSRCWSASAATFAFVLLPPADRLLGELRRGIFFSSGRRERTKKKNKEQQQRSRRTTILPKPPPPPDIRLTPRVLVAIRLRRDRSLPFSVVLMQETSFSQTPKMSSEG